MKRVIIDNGDGTVSILVPANCGLTINEIAEKDCGGLPYEIVDISQIPSDRTFRSAWTKGASKVDVDMPRARDIYMAKIRAARNAKLQELDIEDIKGNDVAAQKQALRDLPASVNLNQFNTPEELKAFWPSELS